MKWTLDAVIEEAKRYPSRTAFARGSSVAYRRALTWKILDMLYPVEIIWIDKPAKQPRPKLITRSPMVIDRSTIPMVQTQYVAKYRPTTPPLQVVESIRYDPDID
jgi:hypothetical protein